MAFFDALAVVEKEREGEVPNHLKDASRDSEGFGHGAGYLYPHAYREHWVAQQYLPAGLQGRIFYQPSDQGREKGVGDRIRQRRELQLAAMREAESAPAEILSLSPPDQARDQWLKRASGDVGTQLERTRQRLFAPLALARHHLVLDLEAGTGLLTWEALRRVPEGGVWAHTSDKIAAVALHETAAHLAEIERPQVLQGPLAALADQIADHNPDILFDAIVGRNALGALAHKAEVIAALYRYLAPHRPHQLGRNHLAPVAAFVPVARLTATRRPRRAPRRRRRGHLRRARQSASQLGCSRISNRCSRLRALARYRCRWKQSSHSGTSSRAISHIGSIPAAKSGTRTPHHLTQHLDEGELRQVRKFFEQSLANHTVTWTTPQVFVVAERQPESDADIASKN